MFHGQETYYSECSVDNKRSCQKDLKAAVFIYFGEEVIDLFLELESTVSSQKGKHEMNI